MTGAVIAVTMLLVTAAAAGGGAASCSAVAAGLPAAAAAAGVVAAVDGAAPPVASAVVTYLLQSEDLANVHTKWLQDARTKVQVCVVSCMQMVPDLMICCYWQSHDETAAASTCYGTLCPGDSRNAQYGLKWEKPSQMHTSHPVMSRGLVSWAG